jgi:hypothetical protein
MLNSTVSERQALNKPQDDTNAAIEAKIWHWIDNFIIQENICPFAKKERELASIQLLCYSASSALKTCDVLLEQADKMHEDASIETSILIAKEHLDDFDEYLFHLEEANLALAQNGYEGEFQLASFHPEYLFEGEAEDSLSHYSNRAPYPCFHIIREESISKALKSFANPENIPKRNIEHCEQLGKEYFEKLFNN